MIKLRPILRLTVLSLLIASMANVATGQQTRRNPLSQYFRLCDAEVRFAHAHGFLRRPVGPPFAWTKLGGRDSTLSRSPTTSSISPHKDDLPTNHNRPYDLAAGAAQAHGLLLPRAAEITRARRPGHFQRPFPRRHRTRWTPGLPRGIQAANEQGAFVSWNHQGGKARKRRAAGSTSTPRCSKEMVSRHGGLQRRVVLPSAHQWCLEKNLTMMGNSDIHGPDLREGSTDGPSHDDAGVRQGADPEAVKEALLAGRTVVWYKDQLIGRREYLEPLSSNRCRSPRQCDKANEYRSNWRPVRCRYAAGKEGRPIRR